MEKVKKKKKKKDKIKDVELREREPKEDGAEPLLTNLRPAKAKYQPRKVGPGGFSVVNTEKFGRRLRLGKAMQDELGNPEQVQVAFTDEGIVIASEIPENTTFYNLSKGNVYSSGLVQEITEEFGLDFSNKTCISFSDIQYEEIESVVAAIIKIPKEDD